MSPPRRVAVVLRALSAAAVLALASPAATGAGFVVVARIDKDGWDSLAAP